MRFAVFLCLSSLFFWGCPDETGSDSSGEDGAIRTDGGSGGALDGAIELSVLALTPNRGSTAGGEVVVVSGRGLTSVTRVRFGEADGVDLAGLTDRQLRVTTPPGMGTVAVIVETDEGASATLENGFTYGIDQRPAVGWCNTQHPITLELTAEAASPVYGRVYVEGCTDGEATCPGIEMELGVGPVDTAPSDDAWRWSPATLNPDHQADDNDEYTAPLVAQAPGEYAYAFRARLTGGPWTECDLGGSEDGFSTENAGRLTVSPRPPDGFSIDWCQIQHPAETAVALGGQSEPIYGQVLVAGCSEGALHCDGVEAQVGHGPAGGLPSDEWTWVDARYNEGVIEGDNDEYSAALTLTESGSFAYAYRFRMGAEGEWVYCDSDGSDEMLVSEQLGAIEVSERPIEWCTIQFPETLEGSAGAVAGPVYGRVYAPECTDGAARCWGLRMQLGVGPDGVSPIDEPDGFRWSEGTFNPGHIEDNNDEFEASQTLAETDGRFVLRFSGNGGETWTLCDQTGTPFDAADMGTVVLSE